MLTKFRLFSLTAILSISITSLVFAAKPQLVENTNVISCEVDVLINDRPKSVRRLDPEHISLLNWNIYKGQRDDWKKDLSAFAENHNLMTIQEGLLNTDLTDLLDHYDFSWIMNTAFRLDDTDAGVMNIAAADALHSCGFKVKEPLIRLPKSALISYYAIDGTDQTLLVANIHGINFTLGMQSYREQLTQLFTAVERHDGPMIVAGDFNSWSEERLALVEHFVEKLSLSAIEYGVNNKTHMFGNAIDHVFYRHLELLSNEVIEVISSDHNPISVNFRFNTAV